MQKQTALSLIGFTAISELNNISCWHYLHDMRGGREVAK